MPMLVEFRRNRIYNRGFYTMRGCQGFMLVFAGFVLSTGVYAAARAVI